MPAQQRPLRYTGPIAARTTYLLPRMVARMGMASFAQARFDFVDDLPELRPVARAVPTDEAEQITQLSALLRAEARRCPPEPTSFPALALRVMDRASDKQAGLGEIVGLVAQDAAVAATVLRVAASPRFHGGAGHPHNLKTAVALLGLDEVRRVAAGVASRSLYDLEIVASHNLFERRWNDLFHRSMTVAFTSGWLASQLKSGGPERAFLGGMFHDIGKTLALRSLASLLMGGKVPFSPPESTIDGALESLHVDLGVQMHEAFGLPDDLAAICKMHHEWAPPSVPELRTLHVVRLCSALADLRADPASHPGAADVVRTSVRALALQFKQYRLLTARLNAFAEQVSEMFSLRDSAASPLPEDDCAKQPAE